MSLIITYSEQYIRSLAHLAVFKNARYSERVVRYNEHKYANIQFSSFLSRSVCVCVCVLV